VVGRKTNRRHMTGDHHGRTARRATLLVTAMNEILGTHNSCSLFFLPLSHILARVVALCLPHAGQRPGIRLRLRHALFDPLVYARLREALGGQAAWAISGGAPLDEDLGHFLRGAWITVLEGWGLTETAGPATMNPPPSSGSAPSACRCPAARCGSDTAASSKSGARTSSRGTGRTHRPPARYSAARGRAPGTSAGSMTTDSSTSPAGRRN